MDGKAWQANWNRSWPKRDNDTRGTGGHSCGASRCERLAINVMPERHTREENHMADAPWTIRPATAADAPPLLAYLKRLAEEPALLMPLIADAFRLTLAD